MIKRKLGLYIHIPFCMKKCDYCDFVSAVGTAEEQAYYIRMLMKEIRSYEAISTLYDIDTIFFGGGTPSAVNPELIARVMTLLREQYEVLPDAEISIECNPGTLTEEKLGVYKEAGFNRLSIGLQSVNEDELKNLGRIHTYGDFLKSYELARSAGFHNINIDLMLSLPEQNMEKWSRTLTTVADLEPEHISAYSLTIERGTPFYERYGTARGSLHLPTEEADREMYHYTKTYLESKGWMRYEISNFARKGRECRHNIRYWDLSEYLGFGQSASSYLGGKRFTNPRLRQEYWDYAKDAYAQYRTRESQTEKEAMEEFMFLGLRMSKGIASKEFEERFHVPFESVYGKPVETLKKQELLEEKDNRLRLTERGIDVSNRVLANFLL